MENTNSTKKTMSNKSALLLVLILFPIVFVFAYVFVNAITDKVPEDPTEVIRAEIAEAQKAWQLTNEEQMREFNYREAQKNYYNAKAELLRREMDTLEEYQFGDEFLKKLDEGGSDLR